MNSDEIVQALQPYGIVRTFQCANDKTFSAVAELFMHGIKAEVRSGFNHPTMNAALSALYEKVMNVVVRPEIEQPMLERK